MGILLLYLSDFGLLKSNALMMAMKNLVLKHLRKPKRKSKRFKKKSMMTLNISRLKLFKKYFKIKVDLIK